MGEPTFEQGLAHHKAGQLAQAEAIYRSILARQPRHSDALHLLGAIAYEAKQFSAGADLVGRAIQINPRVPSYHNTMGLILIALERLDEAVAEFGAALAIQPAMPEVHFNLANALQKLGRLDEAVAHYRQSPDSAIAHVNLGSALSKLGQIDAALLEYRRAIQLQPNLAVAHYNLGNALRKTAQVEPAVASYREAIRLDPGHDDALLNLGNLLKDKGELDDAIDCFRRAMAIDPRNPQPHSNLLFTMQLHSRYDAGMIHQEHLRWRQLHADQFKASIRPHANDRDPQRRLRIGYVSPDFQGHSVARFMLPLLANHHPGQFEISCYANVRNPDEFTARVQDLADHWRNIWGLPDEQVAEVIRQDRIDILVDLALHTAHNRLLVFARKPAPVQVTYLAYCGTSGLDTIDYRLTDPLLDPPGANDSCYSEESVRVQSYWCYAPPDSPIEVNPLPASTTGFVTFGCLNNFCKVTSPTLQAWARILAALPTSRLMLHVLEGADPTRVLNELAGLGIDPSRITLVGRLLFDDYLRLYHQIDIALDPFPYNGGTTTCDALWMGVPVVSLAGRRGVERAGLSLLSHVGLENLVASNQDQYVEIATKLASDSSLPALRANLRDRMKASTLMDAPRFARDIEAAYRRMWRRWCDPDKVNP